MNDGKELIDRYFDLAPRPDTDAYFAQFADDAVVEDEGQAHRGIAAIRAWRAKVPRVAYTVLDVKASGTGHDAAVDIAGDFPGSPVTLTFHFQFAASGRITTLTIRP
jgi:ketosteroid isomerase-like protein